MTAVRIQLRILCETSIERGSVRPGEIEMSQGETPRSPRSSLERVLDASRAVVKDDPVRALALVAATVLAVLSFSSILESPSTLAGATLFVLGLLMASLLLDAKKRIERDDELRKNSSSVNSLDGSIKEMSQDLRRAALIREVPAGGHISSSFADAMASATSWRFRGGTGTFLRAWTLPELSKRAMGGAGVPVTIEILDPQDAACEAYALYRRRLEGADGGAGKSKWNVSYVRTESAASIIAAVWYRQHSFISVRLVFSRAVSALRYDIATRVAILTHADKNFPALVASVRSPLYNAFVAELDQSTEAGEVSLADLPMLPQHHDAITPEIAEDLLSRLRISAAEIDLKQAVNWAFRKENPYPI